MTQWLVKARLDLAAFLRVLRYGRRRTLSEKLRVEEARRLDYVDVLTLFGGRRNE
jgi:hypothetical protein